jgi:hypothetical protein
MGMGMIARIHQNPGMHTTPATCTTPFFGSNYEYLFRTPSMCQLLSGCDNSYKVYAIDEHIEVYLANIINNNIKLATWFIIACLLMTD